MELVRCRFPHLAAGAAVLPGVRSCVAQSYPMHPVPFDRSESREAESTDAPVRGGRLVVALKRM
jgi:hypothetical protein